jgi:SAM-dependent MidA family methyltransferase
MLSELPLPALSADEAAHATRVAAHIGAEIAAAGGWIPFSQFMQLALYAPGLGYYSAGARKFGASGDFVTAPELTPVFARCLAGQVAEILEQTGGGDVIEVGAGSGAMAAELLEALAARDALPERYLILEVSADLRERQESALAQRDPALSSRVAWLESPPSQPWRGALLANEVADALPVERFRLGAGGTEAVGVVARDGGFAFEPRPAGDQLAAEVGRRLAGLPEALPSGYESEVSLLLRPWIGALATRMRRGAMLFVDYGLARMHYYHPSRAGGSLCGFFRHRRVEDVLANPGLQDITAWVDFTELAEAGAEAGLGVGGFSTQAHFLLAAGLDRELAAAGERLDAVGRAQLAQAASTLVLPGEMGERFKVIALTRGIDEPLSGFAFRDLAATL